LIGYLLGDKIGYLLGDKLDHLLANGLAGKEQGLNGEVLLTDDKETLLTC